MDLITIAILCKQKAHCLPAYLNCIYNQTYPKDKILIYIRSNNNTDASQDILEEWCSMHSSEYHTIYQDYSSVPEKVEDLKPHDWTAMRFEVLGKIRQASIDWAHANSSHYFVVDCDNFIIPETLEALHATKLPVVGPLLKANGSYYSNYHIDIDDYGYCKPTHSHIILWDMQIPGINSVKVIHCTYFIDNAYLKKLYYQDGTHRHEYVIFSDSARKQNILQFLDTRKLYGYISFADDIHSLQQEPWYPTVSGLSALVISPQAFFANRISMMASCIAVALHYNKEPYYVWCDHTNARLNDLKAFSSYFEEVIPKANPSYITIHAVYTEWTEEYGWFSAQSGGQKLFPNYTSRETIGNEYKDVDANVLIETSNVLLTSNLNVDMREVYTKYFKPLEKYMQIIRNIPKFACGLFIDRGDILNYCPESRQSTEEILNWIEMHFSGCNMLIVCSDAQVKKDIILASKSIDILMLEIETLEKWELDFVEFLALAYNCDVVCGTPKSLHAEEAARFGGNANYIVIGDM